MKMYPIVDKKGNTFYVLSIGTNHNALGMMIGGIASSYNKFFDSRDEVYLESDVGDIKYCIIGNIKEAYELLKKIVQNNNPTNIFDYSKCVQEVILNYFGDYSNVDSRLQYFKDTDSDGTIIGNVSNLAHKNAAMCTERAMVAQNLLKQLGIDATFKMSGVIINNKTYCHAFNLIASNDKYYLFDASIPTGKVNEINPIICEIPKDVYDKISKPNTEIGESIHVNHFNPLQNNDCDIIYDAGRDYVYEACKVLTK